jgi:hypothetical protein
MGEAKRRKLKDPNFGKTTDPFFLLPPDKQKEKIKVWSDEASRALKPGFKPDYGHWYLSTFGCKPINMFITPPYAISTDPMGKMLIASTDDFCISILIKKDQYRKNVQGKEGQPLSMELQVLPKSRYQSRETNEFVIPFIVVSFL